jgi:type IV pilus assembly protein PilA
MRLPPEACHRSPPSRKGTTLISRIRKSIDERDGGFTLIELLVVMIIIGILAAIAIPVFLNQRHKAVDTAAKADVTTLGKEVATYFVDGTAMPAITGPALGRYTVATNDAGKVSANIAFNNITGTGATDWCVSVTETNGTVAHQMYSAAGGLATGVCT